MLVAKSFANNPKPQSGGTYQGWEVSPLRGCGLTIIELLPTYHRFAVGKFNQVHKSYVTCDAMTVVQAQNEINETNIIN